MTVRVYRSTDGSAPVLDGQVGSLVAVLDGCLVDGYGAHTAAGWAKSYAGTNTATYRQGTGSPQYYLHVNDNGPGVGVGKEARFWGSENASAVLTGTVLFPTAAQLANGLFLRKSATADATARGWILIADGRTLYLWTATGDVANTYAMVAFGDIYSLRAGTDPGRCWICGRGTENSATMTSTVDAGNYQAGMAAVLTGHYLARDITGFPGAIAAGKGGNTALDSASAGVSTTALGVGIVAYKNPADTAILLSPVRVFSTASGNTYRGRLRGLWAWHHALSACSDGDTFTGTGALTGKTFLVIKQGGGGGVFVVETSDTWETNA